MSSGPSSELTRRRFAGAALGALFAPALGPTVARAASSLTDLRGGLDATETGLRPGAVEDQGGALTKALDEAAASGRPLFLPPGRYAVANVILPERAQIVGVPGESRLVFAGGDFMLRGEHAQRLRLQGVTLDGNALPLAAEGLLDADDIADIGIDDCDFLASGAAGVRLRASAGRVQNSRFDNLGTVGVYLRQAAGMTVEGNVVSNCGNTGILVARDSESEDGTIVRGNRVSAIRADSGGNGQNGNGINLDKANGVVIADNRVDGCAFSAIRCFASDTVAVTGNVATNSVDMAIYVEFAWEGAVVADNFIDGGNGGISMTNFETYNGRLGTCSGNVIRNVRGGPTFPDGNPGTRAGIGVEADIAVTGNVVEDADWGLLLGWGPNLRNVTATGNVIRRTTIGIAVSVVEGAGPALIANNLIAESETGAILGMRWTEVGTGELADGAEAPPGLTLQGNRKA